MYRSPYVGRTAPLDMNTSFRRAEIETYSAELKRFRDHINDRRVETWPTSRKLAILFIARTKNALAVIAKMSGSNVRAGQKDFLFLHELTIEGWKAADRATFLLAGELGMHIPDYKFDSWSEHRVRCSCGFTGSINRRMNRSATSNLTRQFNEHLADPNKWKEQRARVQAIIENVGKATTAVFKAE